ncbi:hypothetical protein [Aromatoleum tolulyticum]|nr:hypothetical protein [Aromatoleum tolulyticum]
MQHISHPMPQPKTSELEQRLVVLFDEQCPDDFRLRRLEGDALKQVASGVDVAAAYTVLGGVAFLRMDERAMRSAFERAFSCPGIAVESYLNYATFLSALLYFEESQAILSDLVQRFPDNPTVLGSATEAAMAAGRFRFAADCRSAAHRLGLSDQGSSQFNLTGNPMLPLLLDRLAGDGVDERVIHQAVQVAGEVIRRRHGQVISWVGDFTDAPSMVSMFTVRAEFDDIAKTNLLIADALVEHGLDDTASYLTLSCVRHADAYYA